MTQVFYHAMSQALPQFPLLQNRPGDAFREDPRLPGTRWEPGLDDCNPPPLLDLGLACTHSECPGPPLPLTPITAQGLRPPQVWRPLAPPPRTHCGGSGHSPAPRAVQRPRPGQKRGRGLCGTAPPTGGHHGPISARCGPLRPRPWGSALPNQKERLVRRANQKLAKRARRGKRTWPRVRGRWRGPGLMASGRHQ